MIEWYVNPGSDIWWLLSVDFVWLTGTIFRQHFICRFLSKIFCQRKSGTPKRPVEFCVAYDQLLITCL